MRCRLPPRRTTTRTRRRCTDTVRAGGNLTGEAPYATTRADYDVHVENGFIKTTLRDAQDVDSALEQRILTDIEAILRARQLLIHRPFQLSGPRVRQINGEREDTAIRLRGVQAVLTGHPPDVIVNNSSGNVITDSRAERAAKGTAFLDALVSKIPRSAVLRALLESYSRSVSDPANELVHLFEIRDALQRQYNGKLRAQKALGITDNQWSAFGKLTNVEPVEQGRHRGKHAARRPATKKELAEARDFARRCIEAFATTV